MSYDYDLNQISEQAHKIARNRWGDVPITVELLSFDDGDVSAKAFHTIWGDDQKYGRVKLLWTTDGVCVEMVEVVDSHSERETYYSEVTEQDIPEVK